MNPKYFDDIEAKIDSINTCVDLSIVTNEIQAELNEMKTQIQAQIDKLSILLINPTDLGSVITWINHMIDNITGSYTKALAELAYVVSRIATITTKLANKASELGCTL